MAWLPIATDGSPRSSKVAELIVRPATASDLPAIGKLAGELVRMHHGFDAQRFMLVDGVEAGYERYFRHELTEDEVVILTAEVDAEVAGYAYGRLEPRDWNSLVDAHGAIHDVFVDARMRRRGVARQLLIRMLETLAAKGAPRVLLHTATQNVAARRLFASLGFRQTMLEMTRES
jgi:ribosomal protein S18 acetylase RimI-like enzyme